MNRWLYYALSTLAFLGVVFIAFSPTKDDITFGAIVASSTTFSTAGYRTYVVSANACTTDIAAWGAGGGGATGASAQGGAGGGGGGFASSTITTTPGTTIRLYIAPSVALETNGGTTTASTTAPATIVAASGGSALLAAIGALGGRGSVGTVTRDGGNGGNATTGTGDESGGGGAAAGPHGVGGNGGSCDGSTTVGCGGGGANGGGNGTNNTITAGNAGPNAGGGGQGSNTGTNACANGSPGTYGGGGGGGGDDGEAGCNGAAPGGGGGGGEGGGGTGAAGQIIVTEFINDAGCGGIPSVTTTNPATNITETAATIGGNITDINGDNAITRGFATSTVSTLATSVSTTSTPGDYGTGTWTQAFSNTNLTGNTTYYFRAYATNDFGTGLGSIVSLLTLPGVPTNVTFSGVTQTNITVNWSAPTGGAATYNLEQCKTGTVICSLTTGISGTSQANTLEVNTRYDFAVQSVNATGVSAWTATSSQSTLPQQVLMPSGTINNKSGSIIIK